MNRLLAAVAVLGVIVARQATADSAPGQLEVAALPRLIEDMHEELIEQGSRAGRVLAGRRVAIGGLTDARPGDHQVIGWNEQDPVTTREDVSRWLAVQLTDMLRSGGVEVVDGRGDLTLSATIAEAVVRRSGRKYQATVTVEWAVSDPSGRELWRGKKTGSADERGRLELENFAELFEKAAVAMLDEWWKDAQLPAALAPARPEGPQANVKPGDVGLTLLINDLERHGALAAGALAGKRVSLAPMIDLRHGDRAVIGRNAEENRTVTARGDVVPWFTDRLLAVLRQGGVEVVPRGGEVEVSTSIVRGIVDEGDHYIGVVVLQVVLTDASRRELWRGLEMGVSDVQAGTFKLGVYPEALSDAFLSALDVTWSDPQLLAALGRPAPRVEAAPPSSAPAQRSSLEGIKLEFRPTTGLDTVAELASRTLTGRRVVVRPFADARPAAERYLVGRHRFVGGDSLVTTREDVGAFCAAQLTGILKRGGLTVVPEGGDLIISSTITQLMVEEQEEGRVRGALVQGMAPIVKRARPWGGGGLSQNPYFGTVILEVSVEDAAQKRRWKGYAIGTATNWGATFTRENHRDTLSDALLGAYADLLEALGPVTAPAK